MLRKNFRRNNYRDRTIEQLEQDLNEAWAEIRTEKLKRWVVTLGVIILWEVLKSLV